MPSSPPNLRAPAWDCPSAVPSSNRMAAACGPSHTPVGAQRFSSPCPAKPPRIGLRSQTYSGKQQDFVLRRRTIWLYPECERHQSVDLARTQPSPESRHISSSFSDDVSQVRVRLLLNLCRVKMRGV